MSGVTERRHGGRAAIGLVAVVAILMLSGTVANALVEDHLTTALAVRAATPLPYDPTTITVRFKTGIDRARMTDVTEDMGCSVDSMALYVPGLCTIRIPAGDDFRKWVDIFAARLDVGYAEPTFIDRIAFTPNDPSYGSQWHFPLIGMPNAWDKIPSRGNTSVVVCVLDSGVAYETYNTFIIAPDLVGVNFVAGTDIINGDSHPNDDRNHGTHVCGTIAQKTNNSLGVAGMADGVSIMPVKTLDASGSGSHQDFADGLAWAVSNGAHIVNYSAGGSHSATKQNAVIAAHGAGVLLIAAMGNDGVVNPVNGYPGRYSQAFGVMAVDRDKNLAWYSNWGADGDISAPGGETSPTASNGVLQNTFSGSPSNMGYYYFQGTSMATPHVTGLAALLKSKGVYTTRAQMKSRIEATAEDLGAAGKDTTFGWGLIDADAALGGGRPTLAWAGTWGYKKDGYEPSGETRFRFRVKYKDSDGDVPSKALCRIRRRKCDGSWEVVKALNMNPGSGAIQTGRLYSISTKLTNDVYQYKFFFQAVDGVATGVPARYNDGPLMVAAPKLCWSTQSGYITDGVHPNSGPAGTRFRYKVKYMDSWGTPPATRKLQVMRNGTIIKTVNMLPAKGGDFRTGKIYVTSLKLVQGGTYKYRFRFADDVGPATGAPSKWKTRPTITGVASSMVTSLAAMPTAAGAQVTFTLSDSANVTATVLNVAGRPIRTIANDQALDTGLNTLLWDRKSNSGLPVPAGLYMIRVEAIDAEGGRSSSVATVALR